MYKYLTDAAYLRDYKIWVKFNTKEEGVVDLSYLASRNGIFSPLRDIDYFRQVEFSQELDTISWPNGADIAPETLYELMKSSAQHPKTAV